VAAAMDEQQVAELQAKIAKLEAHVYGDASSRTKQKQAPSVGAGAKTLFLRFESSKQVIISYFAGVVFEALALTAGVGFQMLVIVLLTFVIFSVFENFLTSYVVPKVLSFTVDLDRSDSWQNVLLNMIDFVGTLLMLVLFTFVTQALRDSWPVGAFSPSESLLGVIVIALVMFSVFETVKKLFS